VLGRGRPSDARIYDLAWYGHVQAEDEATVEAARWIVWEAARQWGPAPPAFKSCYKARSRGEYEGMTVPAINLRAQTFDMARVILENGRKERLGGPSSSSWRRSEQTYTFQARLRNTRPAFSRAPSRPGWKGPVFIQGDHYQFNARSTRPTPRR